MKKLKHLSKSCFDRCLLLAAGRMVFSGPVLALRSHFDNYLNCPVPSGVGEADWYIQVINVERGVSTALEKGNESGDEVEARRMSRRSISWFPKFRRSRRASSADSNVSTSVVPRADKAEVAGVKKLSATKTAVVTDAITNGHLARGTRTREETLETSCSN